ncbi:MAG: hypothetical protein OEY20_07710, partial [Gemmatimonadota bacterium]|nr:hypothetical protein [Gemmatimonadota bacterium]
MRALNRVILPIVFLAAGAAPLTAQGPSSYEACYVPGVGAIYLINQPGLPTACLGSSHVAVSWTTSSLADGTVTEAKLAFDPATQAELDAFIAGLAAAGTVNGSGNPVDWTQLKNVPAEFADGVDNTGGASSDLVCVGCVETTDLADAAVTGVKLAVAAVATGHLAFDPATQAELDAFVAALTASGTINAGGNPVDWTQLKNVPAAFADGVDNTGGTPSDLVCTDCVETSDLADGAVTEPKLGFDPATQAELDAFLAALTAAGTINAAGNPVDWTQLKNVPADFADGVDNSGGTPSDLVCVGCVGTTDLADAAVTETQLADGGVTEAKLAFDPSTQAELDAFVAALAAAGVINTGGNPVDWTQLKNVPADFADGVDN